MRVLLNEKVEPLLVDLRKSASGLRYSVGSTRPAFDQGCLANDGTFPRGFDRITNPDRFPLPVKRTFCRLCHVLCRGILRA
jgi:hypothetical protein